MKRCVIVGGAPVNNYEYIRSRLKGDDFLIFCDCGLRHAEGIGRKPDMIVGDFDSYADPQTDVETVVLPREKDDTDTFYAVKKAISRGFTDFLLIGVIGNRLDHSMGNLSILVMLDGLGATASAIDDFSEMEIVSKYAEIGDSYPYFSVINLTGTGQDITITDAKYPLEHGEISWEYQYGISNEVLPGKTARVTVGSGNVLLIRGICEDLRF